MTAGDVRVLLVWVVLWLTVYRLERWLGRRSAGPAAPSPEALASQARFQERLDALRAAEALQALSDETERLDRAAPPKPVGLRLTGTDAMIVNQLIELSRHPEPRRSAR